MPPFAADLRSFFPPLLGPGVEFAARRALCIRRLHCLPLCVLAALPNCILIVRSKQTQLSANNFSWMRDKQNQKIASHALSGFFCTPFNVRHLPFAFPIANLLHLQAAEKWMKSAAIRFRCKFVFWLWLREPLMVCSASNFSRKLETFQLPGPSPLISSWQKFAASWAYITKVLFSDTEGGVWGGGAAGLWTYCFAQDSQDPGVLCHCAFYLLEMQQLL